jgi:hypothetical protein
MEVLRAKAVLPFRPAVAPVIQERRRPLDDDDETTVDRSGPPPGLPVLPFIPPGGGKR